MRFQSALAMTVEGTVIRNLFVAALVDAVGLGLRLQAFFFGSADGEHGFTVRRLHAQ